MKRNFGAPGHARAAQLEGSQQRLPNNFFAESVELKRALIARTAELDKWHLTAIVAIAVASCEAVILTLMWLALVHHQ